MAGDEKKSDVSTDEFDGEFGLSGNAPAGGEEAYTDKGRAEESEAAESVSMDDVDREIQGLQELEGLEDNVALLEAREKKAAEAEADEGGEEGDEEIEAEEEADEEVEGEEEEDEEQGEEEEEEEEGGSEEDDEEREESEAEDDGTPWGDWLDEHLEEVDERQALLMELLSDDRLVIPYRAGKEERLESFDDIVRKAAGYAGEEAVSRRSIEVETQREQLEHRQAELETAADQLEQFQETLTSQIDDPERFHSFLSARASLEYLEDLGNRINDTVQRARQDPQTFQMNRRLAGIEGALQSLMQGGSGNGSGAGPDRGGTPDDRSADASGAAIPDDLGFQPGVGYTEPYHRMAWRDVGNILSGADGTRVSRQDVIDQWSKEGKKRQIHDVARDLIKRERRDSGKRDIALDPPTKGRTPKGKVGGGKKKKSAGESGSEGGSPQSWDDIQSQVEREVAALQDSGG